MKIDSTLQANAIISELTSRFRQYRISYPMTRKELSEKSMVSLGTIARFENGNDIGLSNLIKLLKALDLENGFELLIPDMTDRPSFHIENKKPRQRAGRTHKKTSDWKWGDES